MASNGDTSLSSDESIVVSALLSLSSASEATLLGSDDIKTLSQIDAMDDSSEDGGSEGRNCDFCSVILGPNALIPYRFFRCIDCQSCVLCENCCWDAHICHPGHKLEVG